MFAPEEKLAETHFESFLKSQQNWLDLQEHLWFITLLQTVADDAGYPFAQFSPQCIYLLRCSKVAAYPEHMFFDDEEA